VDHRTLLGANAERSLADESPLDHTALYSWLDPDGVREKSGFEAVRAPIS
jgi:hypothetical protein